MQIKDLDNVDRQILNLLSQDARMTFSSIGKEVGLSRVAVKNRVAKLQNEGIILGYGAILNTNAGALRFLLNVETSQESFDEVKQYLAASSQTLTVVQTSGKCRLVVIGIAADGDEIRNFANDLYGKEGVTLVQVYTVADVIKGRLI